MGRVAAALGVVPGTTTSMIKALADSGLVHYEPRVGVSLTAQGEKLALHVLRRHRLVELFLVEILGLDWSEIDEEAEQLEHVISDRVLESIDALLGRPTVDPHGDPIPSDKGEFTPRKLVKLLDCPRDREVRIARVTDQRAAFLRFAQSNGLRPGASLKVEASDPVGESVTLKVNGGESITLGAGAAGKILVE